MLKNQHPVPRSRAGKTAQNIVLLLFCAGAGLALDLVSKQWAWDALRPPTGHPRMIWAPILELSFAFNTGGAFGFLRGAGLGWPFFALMAALAIVYMLVMTARMPGADRLRFVALGLLISGALGNLHDRLLRVDELGRHGVVDFIKINYPWGGSWPNFNVADVALLVGAALLLLSFYRGERELRARRSHEHSDT